MPDPRPVAALDSSPAAEPADRCPWCGTTDQLLWVTSHVQCGACRQVVETCCEGPAGCA